MCERELLSWLLTSRRPGRKVLDFLCELVLEMISSSFVILDKEKTENYTRSEMISLMYKIGTGEVKVEDGFGSFFRIRLSRLVKNLLAQEALEQTDQLYFSQIEGRANGENGAEDFLERWLFLKADEEQAPPGAKGNGKNGFCQAETLLKALRIERTKEFYPGCLGRRRKSKPKSFVSLLMKEVSHETPQQRDPFSS